MIRDGEAPWRELCRVELRGGGMMMKRIEDEGIDEGEGSMKGRRMKGRRMKGRRRKGRRKKLM